MTGKTLKFCILLVAFFIGDSTLAAGPTSNQELDPELVTMLKKAANDSDSFRDHFEARVWLTDMSHRLQKRVQDAQTRIRLLKNIHYEATRAGLDPGLVMAIVDVESNFNQFAISRVGARGLMQIMPFWLKKIGKPGESLFDVKTNLRFGCTILKYYLKREHGNITAALASYNGSSGKYRYPKKVYYALDNRWFPQ